MSPYEVSFHARPSEGLICSSEHLSHPVMGGMQVLQDLSLQLWGDVSPLAVQYYSVSGDEAAAVVVVGPQGTGCLPSVPEVLPGGARVAVWIWGQKLEAAWRRSQVTLRTGRCCRPATSASKSFSDSWPRHIICFSTCSEASSSS